MKASIVPQNAPSTSSGVTASVKFRSATCGAEEQAAREHRLQAQHQRFLVVKGMQVHRLVEGLHQALVRHRLLHTQMLGSMRNLKVLGLLLQLVQLRPSTCARLKMRSYL